MSYTISTSDDGPSRINGKQRMSLVDQCSVLYITVCPFVSFPLAIILSVFCQFPFGHYIVCLLSASLWPLYCLSFVSFPLAMILSVFFDVRLLVTSLIPSNPSCALAKLSARYVLFLKSVSLLVLMSYANSISDDVPLVLQENEECH